jgi:dTDP-L-rhamnose 4-epimerase
VNIRVLITGGAGFIGKHLARRLLREGCHVTILDNFSPQIHGDMTSLPPDLEGHVDLRVGDVRDEALVGSLLKGRDVIVHLAAETGTGQSMYEVLAYEEVNVRGTAILVQCLVNDNTGRDRKLIVASSRAVYGEGRYLCREHGAVYPGERKVEDMLKGKFEPLCPVCGSPCEPLPTAEEAPLQPSSFYGLTKQMQEQMVLLFSRAKLFSGVALRYQNVYGPGQSLRNPYTGILAIFSNQARLNQPIHIFEDGLESRDFVYIDDVIEATWGCIMAEGMQSEVLNVGGGSRIAVCDLVKDIVRFFDSRSKVEITGAFRQGDIRHNMADLTKAQKLIGFTPQWRFSRGIGEFLEWATSQDVSKGRYEASLTEMRQRGLLHG